jgi:hypothetical protein
MIVGTFSKPHGPGCLKPAMARNDSALGVSENRIGETERLDGSSKLFGLALWMGAGVALIRNEIAHRTVGYGEPRRNGRCCGHEQEPKQPTSALVLGYQPRNLTHKGIEPRRCCYRNA